MRLPAQRDAGCGSLDGEREEVSALEAAVAPPVPMLGPQLAGSGRGRGGTRPGCAGGCGAGASTGPQGDAGATSSPVMMVKAAEGGCRGAQPRHVPLCHPPGWFAWTSCSDLGGCNDTSGPRGFACRSCAGRCGCLALAQPCSCCPERWALGCLCQRTVMSQPKIAWDRAVGAKG